MRADGAGLRSKMTGVTWRAQRLRMMSVGEVLWRLQTRTRSEVWRRRTSWSPASQIRPAVVDTYRFPSDYPPEAVRDVVEQARGLLDGRFAALGQTFTLDDVRWHHDPQSGITVPLDFGPLIDCRNPSLVGNARNIWELNRHQHLSLAALAYALTKDERYPEFVYRQLVSWLDQNPFPLGVNWASSLELGLRLISWVWVYRLLSGSREHELLFGEKGCLWPSIYRHQWMIGRMRSRGSSANNHLIGEMAGLYVSSAVWRVFVESEGWSRLARRVLHREIVRQYFPSGVNRELAFGYHIFSTQLLMLAALEGERAGVPFVPDYVRRLHQAVSASADQVAHGETPPTYGDSDDSVAVGLGVTNVDAPALTQTVMSSWLGGFTSNPESGPTSRLAVAVLLSGVESKARLPAPVPPASRNKAFYDAGLFIMSTNGEPAEVLCLVDAGPLGYLSIAAHGHADALAFTLSVGGEQLVVDAGTYTYHFDAQAREYFRGTRAHNTIAVDGLSQSVPAGPFLWTKKAASTVSGWRVSANGATLEASHDGYERLADPVTHRRTLDLHTGVLMIEDVLEGRSIHQIEWRLHLAPQCRVHLTAGSCEVVGEHHGLELLLDPSLEWSLHVGEPSAGWYSASFNRRQETTTLVGVAQVPLPFRLHNEIRVHG